MNDDPNAREFQELRDKTWELYDQTLFALNDTRRSLREAEKRNERLHQDLETLNVSNDRLREATVDLQLRVRQFQKRKARMRRFAIYGVVILIALVAMSSFCLAAPVGFEIGGPSVLHTATVPGPTVGGTTWHTGGFVLGSVSGTLLGDVSGGVLTILPSELDISGPLGALQITGGEFALGDPAGGTLDYMIDGLGAGTFYFHPHAFNANANSVSLTDGLDLWGQNFLGTGPPNFKGRCFVPLGLDLQGEPIPTPEPASMALLGVGVGALAWRRRRRRS